MACIDATIYKDFYITKDQYVIKMMNKVPCMIGRLYNDIIEPLTAIL